MADQNMPAKGGSAFGGKISISYPPLESEKGVACLSQNRQFQWFAHPTYIYPVIPAYAASLLAKNGYQVFWDDAIAEELTYDQWKERIMREKPDVIAIETKTPVVKMHWRIIDEIKKELSNFSLPSVPSGHLPSGKGEGNGWKPIFVLMGDHVTARPEESLKNCQVDYVMASGDYDFMLLNLANHLSKNEPLEGGFWYRKSCHSRTYLPERQESGNLETGSPIKSGMTNSEITSEFVNSGPSDISKHNLDTLPIIDRKLTRWKMYAYKNGNFKYTPGAYMMSGRDCWWGKCTFCSWTTFFPGEKFRTMSAQKALEEVENLIRLGVKEIMEDSGSLPIGKWLDDFCKGMIDRGYNKKVTISCNMRITGIKKLETWKMMKKAGFRFILFGLESANQETLDKINKNLKVEEIEPGLKMCKSGGLEPHITAMIGYPWETKEMAQKTIDLAKDLFKKGYVDTLQGTIVIPYPGTPLYKYCEENNMLLTRDYDHFDQREMVMKSSLSSADAKEMVQGLYKSFMSPQFIWRKITSIRSFADIKFLFMAGWKWLGKMTDFHSVK
ncbi:MAG TPA: radical SAM protein [Candidatus Moranbacteria bacterium]|nr:radical SAM protein [Candidatus Moranbacteria bacterium]